MKSFLEKLVPMTGIIFFGLAIVFINKILHEHSYHEIWGSLAHIPLHLLLLSTLVALTSYACLTGYDLLALRYVGRSIPIAKAAFTSFIAFSFSNTIGMANLAGGSIRLRIYGQLGLSFEEVLKIILFCSLTFWLGFFSLASITLTFFPPHLPPFYHLSPELFRAIGAFFMVLTMLYIFMSKFRTDPIGIKDMAFPLPRPAMALAQIGIATLDWALAGLTLYLLLPSNPEFTYFHFLSLYVTAQLIALITHVPGGIGVLEGLIISFTSSSHHKQTSSVVAGLIAFRFVYYFLPLLLSMVSLSAFEVWRKKHRLLKISKTFMDWTKVLTPTVSSAIVFLSGSILIASGATPTVSHRLGWLQHLVPLPVLEFSHFFASLTGAMLLIVAKALQNRSNAGRVFTMALLVAGSVFSLIKGLDYEEAILMLSFAFLLHLCRASFHRKASLFTERLTSGWVLSILMVMVGSIWLGLFSYKHVEYSTDMWWNFSFRGDAPRFLRSTVGFAGLLIILGLMRLLRPRGSHKGPALAYDPTVLKEIVTNSSYTYPQLALLGDKSILMNEEKNAFIMFSVYGRSWVSMSDPVGNREAFDAHVWQFKELADKYGGLAVFYQVRPQNLPIYIDLGLQLVKLGEEAIVDLATFSLEGHHNKPLRNVCNRFKREEYTFEIIEGDQVRNAWPAITDISNQWLADKKAKEKGFSMGKFDRAYLENFPFAVLKKGETMVAFANIWDTKDKKELSVDLMRYVPGGPNGIMEYLFIELMLWGKHQGHHHFNLGMAPLSGIEASRLGPKWSQAAKTLYDHGEFFYHFKGLRSYKEKFHPRWEPRYLAYPSNLLLPEILFDLTLLIAGGLKGVVNR